MRRAVRFTLGCGFAAGLGAGLVLHSWPMSTLNFWGLVWLTTWESP